MDEIALGKVISRITGGLEKAADEILKESKVLANTNQVVSDLKDELALIEAKIRAEVSTAINEQTKRPQYPNVDSQNAAVLIGFSDMSGVKHKKVKLLDLLREVEVGKAQLLRLHERRRDLRTEAELLKLLDGSG